MNNNWNKKWNEDIEFLKNTLVNNHKNLFFNISKESFINSIEELKDIIDKLDYNDMKVEISRVVASVGDAHTAVKLPINYIMPLEFYYFKEGIYVIKGSEEYSGLEFCEVIEINNTPIAEVIEELKRIISYENELYLKANVVKFMQSVELLYGLMIIDNIENCNIKFKTLKGDIKNITIKSINVNNYSKLLKSNNEKGFEYISDNRIKKLTIANPLYRKNNNRNYWFDYIDEKEILYFKYNLCKNMIEEPVDEFINRIIKFIEKNNVSKLVIDLRNNTGGDSRLLEPFINYIQENQIINKQGNLFIVIGRDTFSSALLNAFAFKNKTNSILIGEPTGGKPNCYGEIEKVNLPNSKFLITYSTEYYKLIDDDNIQSLFPDINIENSVYDFINGIDQALEIIKEYIYQ